MLCQDANVFSIPTSAGEHFHGEQMLCRRRSDAEPWVVKDALCRGVAAPSDVSAGLFIEPPARQAKLVRDGLCLLDDDAMRPEEGIDILRRDLASRSCVARRASYARAIAAPPKT